MASIRTFTITLPPATLSRPRALAKQLRAKGWQIDSGATDLLNRPAIDPFGTNLGSAIECALLTPRELGLTQHPLITEVLGRESLRFASKEFLPRGKAFELNQTDALLAFCLEHQALTYDRTINAGVHPESPGRILQAHHSPATGERWVYGVRAPQYEKRWSLDHHFLLRVRPVREGEQILIDHAEPQKQEKAKLISLSPRIPGQHDNKVPGLYCGHEAVRSVLNAYGKDVHGLRELRRPGIYGRLVNDRFGRMLPADPGYFLDRHGINSRMYHWLPYQFENKLAAALDAGHLVVVLGYAERRQHGQHFVVVSGYEYRGGYLHWYVTDGQFAKGEYELPSGNVLYTTSDFVRSFPRYGLGLFSLGSYVTEVLSP